MFCVCHGYEPAKCICHVFIYWISCNIALPPSTWYLCRDVSPLYRLAQVSGYSQEFWHQSFQLIPCVSKIRPEQCRWPIYRAGSHNTHSHSSTIHALFVRHSLEGSVRFGWMDKYVVQTVFVWYFLCVCVCVCGAVRWKCLWMTLMSMLVFGGVCKMSHALIWQPPYTWSVCGCVSTYVCLSVTLWL